VSTNLACPKCIELGLAPTYFCTQACFKSNYAAHKQVHTLAKKIIEAKGYVCVYMGYVMSSGCRFGYVLLFGRRRSSIVHGLSLSSSIFFHRRIRLPSVWVMIHSLVLSLSNLTAFFSHG